MPVYLGYFTCSCRLILIFYRCIIVRDVAVECMKCGKKYANIKDRIEKEGIISEVKIPN